MNNRCLELRPTRPVDLSAIFRLYQASEVDLNRSQAFVVEDVVSQRDIGVLIVTRRMDALAFHVKAFAGLMVESFFPRMLPLVKELAYKEGLASLCWQNGIPEGTVLLDCLLKNGFRVTSRLTEFAAESKSDILKLREAIHSYIDKVKNRRRFPHDASALPLGDVAGSAILSLVKGEFDGFARVSIAKSDNDLSFAILIGNKLASVFIVEVSDQGIPEVVAFVIDKAYRHSWISLIVYDAFYERLLSLGYEQYRFYVNPDSSGLIQNLAKKYEFKELGVTCWASST